MHGIRVLFHSRGFRRVPNALLARISVSPCSDPLALPTSGSAQWTRGHDMAANVSGRELLDSRVLVLFKRVSRELCNVGQEKLHTVTMRRERTCR
jgi:hypothetical protein